MRVGYLRVSTTSDEQLRSAETQKRRLHEAKCDRVLVDIGISGHREDGRKGSRFPELLDLILSGDATEVVVPSFDRTQRRLKWGLELLDALEKTGIRLLDLDSNKWMDPRNNPTDVLMLQIRTIFQENESRTRSLKVRRAISSIRRSGKYATGQLPFGYAYDRQTPEGTSGVIADPEMWPVAVAMLQQMLELECNASGWVRQYACLTGRSWTPRGARLWLVNPILRGVVMGKPRSCPVLMDEGTAQQVDAMLARRRGRGTSGSGRIHPLTGLVRCDACGKAMHNVFDQNRSNRYHRLKCMTVGCERYGRGIREDAVRRHVIDAMIAHRSAQLAKAAVDFRVEPPEAAKLRAQLVAFERLVELGAPGIEASIAHCRKELKRVLTPDERPDYRRMMEMFDDPETIAAGSDDELRVLFVGLIEKAFWLGGHDPSCSISLTLR